MKCEFLKVTLNYFLDWRRPPDIPPVHEGISCKNRSQDPRKQCQSQGLGAKTCRRRGRKNNYDFRLFSLSLFLWDTFKSLPTLLQLWNISISLTLVRMLLFVSFLYPMIWPDLLWGCKDVLDSCLDLQHQSIQNTQGALARVVQGV